MYVHEYVRMHVCMCVGEGREWWWLSVWLYVSPLPEHHFLFLMNSYIAAELVNVY